jgi:hypothetical protein
MDPFALVPAKQVQGRVALPGVGYTEVTRRQANVKALGYAEHSAFNSYMANAWV